MAKYFAKQDIVNGVIPNSNGKPNILFKKDDEIIGTQTTAFIFNKNMKGIKAKPTVSGAYIEGDGLFFVPFDVIRIEVGQEPQGSSTTAQNNVGSNNTKSTETKSFFTPKNIIIGLVVIGAILGGLKLAKVF